MSKDRLLSILLVLLRKGKLTGGELAEHFEVSVRTIYRDIDKLSAAGVPVAALGGKAGGFYLLDNYRLEHMVYNTSEKNTMLTMLTSLNVLFGKNKQFNDIVLKFENAYRNEPLAGHRLMIDMSHSNLEPELQEYIFTINQALETSKLLIVHYINRNLESAERIVEPIRLEFVAGQWFVAGFCRNRMDYRRFKLVRIKSMRLGDYFCPRNLSEVELDEIFRRSYSQKNIKVKLRFSERIGGQLTEYFLKSQIEKNKEGGFLVEADFPYEEGLFKFILGFGGDCEVLEPTDVRQAVISYLEHILGKYKSND